MFERLKPRKDCKRAANASRHTPNRDSGQTWSRKVGHRSKVISQGHYIFQGRCKIDYNSRVLKASLRSAAFYARYSRKTEGESVRPPPLYGGGLTSQNVANFYFDLTCDVNGDLEVNKIRFCSTVFPGLSDAVSVLTIGPVVSELERGGGFYKQPPPPPVECVTEHTPVGRWLRVEFLNYCQHSTLHLMAINSLQEILPEPASGLMSQIC